MTEGVDLSQWQTPGSLDLSTVDFAIIRTSHGMTEDPVWRQHFNNVVAAGKPLGLYHYAEERTATPEAQGRFFHDLTSFLTPAQCRYAWWADLEEGQDDVYADRFRIAAQLPMVGVYSNLAGFNGPLARYMHFAMNWLAMPDGTVVPAGWRIPDHILLQHSTGGGVDRDTWLPAQPYPPAWT